MVEESQDVDLDKIVEDLLYVKKGVSREDATYGGWKRELLVEEIISTSEEKLLICTFCNGVLRDAIVVKIAGKDQLRCSVCFTDSNYLMESADLIRSVINERSIRCPLSNKHCKWEGSVIHLLLHLKNCEFLLVPCPLGCLITAVGDPKNKTIQKIPGNHLKDHLTNKCPNRIISCEFCPTKIEASKMNYHILICEEFIIECPNQCSIASKTNDYFGRNEEIYKDKRKIIEIHLYSDCPLQEISCPYLMHGCEAVVLRKDLDQHKSDFMQKHLDLLEARLEEYKMVGAENIVSPFSRPNSPDLDFPTAPPNTPVEESSQNRFMTLGGIEWKFFDYKKKICKNLDSKSPAFYSSGYKFRFHLTLVPRDTIGIYFEVLPGDHDSELVWPLSCELTVKVVNKSSFKDLVKVTRSDCFRDQSAFNRPYPHAPNTPFCCELIPMAELASRRFSLDGSLLIRVFVKCF